MARDLTDGESTIVSTLLGAGPEAERVRILQSQLPRSTYNTIRRRAYDQGWVYDRFLPTPRAGFRYATFSLARPFAEHAQELSQRWEKEPGTCVLWGLGDRWFSVRWTTEPTNPLGSSGPSLPSKLGKLDLVLECDLQRPEVPVYFDYEGAWAHLAGRPRGLRYPRALGWGAPAPASPSPGLLKDLRSMAERPLRPPSEEEFRRFSGPLGLPRSQRRLLAKGWAEWRVFPDLRKLPPDGGRRLRRVVLIWGNLQRESDAELLFRDLWERSSVAPFLFACHDDRVLLGAAGVGGTRENSPSPTPERPRSVMQTLSQHLQGIESHAVSVDEMVVRLDHRYDRLDYRV